MRLPRLFCKFQQFLSDTKMIFYRSSIQKSIIGKCCRTCCFINYFIWRLVYKTTRAKAQKALGNFGEFFLPNLAAVFLIYYRTFNLRVFFRNGLELILHAFTMEILMVFYQHGKFWWKRKYIFWSVSFSCFSNNISFSLFVRTNLLARLKLKNQLM